MPLTPTASPTQDGREADQLPQPMNGPARLTDDARDEVRRALARWAVTLHLSTRRGYRS
jgi:hypothetical protein